MSTVPHILAERRADLARSIEAMEREIDEAESALRDLRTTVLEASAELRGIEAAIIAYTNPSPSGSSASLGLLAPKSEQGSTFNVAQRRGIGEIEL